jgi:hypothetical protein
MEAELGVMVWGARVGWVDDADNIPADGPGVKCLLGMESMPQSHFQSAAASPILLAKRSTEGRCQRRQHHEHEELF